MSEIHDGEDLWQSSRLEIRLNAFHRSTIPQKRFIITIIDNSWCTHRGVAVITTAQLHSTKPKLRFCAGSKPARCVLEICDGEDLWRWSRLEIRLNVFSSFNHTTKTIHYHPHPHHHHHQRIDSPKTWMITGQQIIIIKYLKSELNIPFSKILEQIDSNDTGRYYLSFPPFFRKTFTIQAVPKENR